MSLSKYFWDINHQALKETKNVLQNPLHPKYLQRALTLLSRCDDPKKLFSFLNEEQFIKNWPRIRRYWNKNWGAQDFKAWWDTIYERKIEKRGLAIKPKGELMAIFKTIGNIIKQSRMSKNLSQFDLARIAGISQPDISAIEKGKKNITLETLFRITRSLEIKNLPLK
ncbi:MAG: helix-turn-helix transcriptional regulator [Elusimicrobia bacterium]|nr:helix-turn-helix transcriptional regulator [Elusimicrobiota bacterium]